MKKEQQKQREWETYAETDGGGRNKEVSEDTFKEVAE